MQKVVVANKYFQPGSANINTLNDDCLRYVFRYLDIVALAATINVCVRFNQQSYEISSVSVHNESTLDLVIKYCVATQLKELVCKKIKFSNKLMNRLNPFLATLRKLHLIGCVFEQGSADALPTSMALKDLLISSRSVPNSKDEMEIVNDLVKLNPGVEKLALDSCTMCELSALNNQNYKNLVELELNIACGLSVYYSIEELSSLKVLKLNIAKKSIVPLLKKIHTNSSSIDHLELSDTILNHELDQINFQLKQVKTLKLFGTRGENGVQYSRFLPMIFPELHTLYVTRFENWQLSSDSLGTLLLKAKKLSVLKFINDFPSVRIDIPDRGYDAMLKIIQERVENNSVLIDIEVYPCVGLYPKQDRMTNLDCLNIRVMPFNFTNHKNLIRERETSFPRYSCSGVPISYIY